MSFPEDNDFVINKASTDLSIEELVGKLVRINKGSTVMQIFDSRAIASKVHLVGAYANSVIAFKNNSNKTKSLSMEMLLFASMTDQIEEAIKIAGAKRNDSFVFFCNTKTIPIAIKKLLKVKSNFDPSIAETLNALAILGINARKENRQEIDALILQRMALSRLTSD